MFPGRIVLTKEMADHAEMGLNQRIVCIKAFNFLKGMQSILPLHLLLQQ